MMDILVSVVAPVLVGLIVACIVLVAVIRWGRAEPSIVTLIRTVREGAEYTGALQQLEEAVRALRRREADARGRPEEHALVPGLVAAERIMYELWDAMREGGEAGEDADDEAVDDDEASVEDPTVTAGEYHRGFADAKRACQNILVLEDFASLERGEREGSPVMAALRAAVQRIEREVKP
jgi:hypothetical protein